MPRQQLDEGPIRMLEDLFEHPPEVADRLVVVDDEGERDARLGVDRG